VNPHHTAPAAVEDTELGDTLDDLNGFDWLPGFADLRAALRTIAEAVLTGRYTADASQTLAAVLAGSAGADVLTVVGHLTALITNPDTNPALTHIDPDRAKKARLHGEHLVHHLADDHDLHQHAANAAAAIDHQP
jgi:hypothetical protein